MIDGKAAALGMDGEPLARTPETELARSDCWPIRRETCTPTSDARVD